MKDYPMGHYIIYIISLIFYVTRSFCFYRKLPLLVDQCSDKDIEA